MTTLYCARWVLPISSELLLDGAVAVEADRVVAIGKRTDLTARFSNARANDLGEAAILPGLVNTHSHLELTAMRGFLDKEEPNFFGWLRKLTAARAEQMTPDDLYVSAAWGACEAARAGVTCLGDASDSASQSMTAVRDVGLRGTIFQESFGPDPRLAQENFQTLKARVASSREYETALVRVGVSPHAPYTVCADQLELISEFAVTEKLPLMIHAAESDAEDLLIREGRGPFAEGLARRGIEWRTPDLSTIEYLDRCGVLRAQPLLAHCITVDDADLQLIKDNNASIAHCPKSNAKLGHRRALFAKFLQAGVGVGFGSDSVATNNNCDLFEEARFAVLSARAGLASTNGDWPDATDALKVATMGGAAALGLSRRVGELREGAQADLIAVSLNGAHQLPVYDPVNTLVFASSARDVLLTVVAGREVYRDGRLATVDEGYLRARMKEIAAKLSS